MNKSKVLFICNTYYQMIMAIQMKKTIFADKYCDVIISDQATKTEDLCEKLKDLNIFEAVYYVKTKMLCAAKSRFRDKIIDMKWMLNGCVMYHSIIQNNYDEMVYYNPDIFTHILYAMLEKNNKAIKISRYEEGILSYGNQFRVYTKLKIVNAIRKVMHQKTLEGETKQFYCCYPELYEGNLQPISVPLIKNPQEMGTFLAHIFSLDTTKLVYSERYIYFSSVYDFEGGEPVGELDLVTKIANIVGKENLLIKVHPRDTRNVFETAGLHIDRNSSVPWEAIQLNKDFSDKVFLTANSGSVLSVNMMSKNQPQIVFLYKCCNMKDNPIAMITTDNINSILCGIKKKKYLETVNIIENVEDIL